MNQSLIQELNYSDCQEYTEGDLDLLDSLSFYVEGLIQTPIAICGVVCNLATCVVLASKDMRNSFNLVNISVNLVKPGFNVVNTSFNVENTSFNVENISFDVVFTSVNGVKIIFSLVKINLTR
jgi:hypothetical protein